MKYLAALLLVVGCTGGAETGSTCPPTDPPTYANFAQPFFAKYCTGCHSATTNNRHDAPSSQNYDSEADIRRHSIDIELEAAGGPDAMNMSMPEIGGTVTSKPTEAERVRLGEYLACLQGS